MEKIEQEYQLWRKTVRQADLQEELVKIAQDPQARKERFYKDLEFGTGGMRGFIGAGPNRLNIYTIRKATRGLANFLNTTARPEQNSVVIAYDSRHKSQDFAEEAALVLAAAGIKAYVFARITPTPILSYAVRALGCTAGIVITASHNPKEYNGYKVYNHTGGQVTDALANAITAEIGKIGDLFGIPVLSRTEAAESGLLVDLTDTFLDTYLALTKKLILNPELVREAAGQLKIVYSPLHGAGLVPLTRLFAETGYNSVFIVEQQALADPDFPTVICPNPEEQAACALALEDAQKLDADLILLTDPDADRIGLVVKDLCGEYQQLTGNQTGALLIDYILKTKNAQNALPPNGVVVKTIVTSEMGAQIAAKYGVQSIDVLTGFKYIGEKIAEFEETGAYTFLFGYEESYGYLIGTHARDKDAVQTALILAEMALHHKKNNSSVYARLLELYAEFGYYAEDLLNIQLEGLLGQQKIGRIMDNLRRGDTAWLQPFGLLGTRDYLNGAFNLPPANVLYYELSEDSWCCVRPSGTEPKLKIYLGVCCASAEESLHRLTQLKEAVLKFLTPYV
ncbi:MAG: phospho-sugar mutase [Clostridia bacterium]|jgi:phosphoglucomutase|nr:phospho-sugar mutase [Clostridia bacterium]